MQLVYTLSLLTLKLCFKILINDSEEENADFNVAEVSEKNLAAEMSITVTEIELQSQISSDFLSPSAYVNELLCIQNDIWSEKESGSPSNDINRLLRIASYHDLTLED